MKKNLTMKYRELKSRFEYLQKTLDMYKTSTRVFSDFLYENEDIMIRFYSFEEKWYKNNDK